jgi:hypothetical protein
MKRAKKEGKYIAIRVFNGYRPADEWDPMYEEFSATDENNEYLSTSEGSNS